MLVGIVVTLLASLRPALRATRVPPIAAVREGATLPRVALRALPHARERRCSRSLGFAALAYGLFGSGLGTTQILLCMGIGTLLIFFGVALLSARIARPLAHVLGWPATQDRRRRRRARARQLAAQPAAHRLDRLGADDRARARDARRGARRRDHVELPRRGRTTSGADGYAITAQDNFSPIPIAAGDAAAETPGVEAIANVRGGDAQVFGKTIQATAAQPAAVGIFNLDWVEGSDAVIAALGAHGAIVDDDYAKSHDLTVGSQLDFLSPTRRDACRSQVRGIFDPPTGGSPFGRVTISDAAWDRALRQPAEHLLVRADAGRRDGREPGRARAAAAAVPEREGADEAASSSTTRSPASTRS